MVKFYHQLLIISSVWVIDAIRKQPHILIIIADDLGWEDVGFHGSPQAKTPNLDTLADNGVILMDHYVNPICTPTRSALLTGRYPIHNGMQSSVIMTDEPWGLGLDQKLLPEYLRELGYKTYLVGKWHLGFFSEKHTPLHRGFDEFYGCYTGRGDYWNHTSMSADFIGLDLRDGHDVVKNKNGEYGTFLFSDVAVNMIRRHDQDQPMFMIVSYQAVHSANPYEPMQAPDDMVSKYKRKIPEENRRKYLGMVSALDFGVGQIHGALSESGMLNDTVLFFTSDNGGAADNFDDNHASNYPLRGMKVSLFEGGVRGTSFVYSNFIHKSRVSHDMMHIIDWFPTILHLAGGRDITSLEVDGIDMWPVISYGMPSRRKEILLNIDNEVYRNFALRYKKWKVIYEGWSEAERDWYNPPNYTREEYGALHRNSGFNASTIKCSPKSLNLKSCKHVCLFDIKSDPCEENDLSDKRPKLLETLLKKVMRYKDGMVESLRNGFRDLRSDPRRHGGVWKPWVNPGEKVTNPHKPSNTRCIQTAGNMDPCRRYHRTPGVQGYNTPRIKVENNNIGTEKQSILKQMSSLFS